MRAISLICMAIISALLLFTGCAAKYVCPDGTSVRDPTKCSQYSDEGKVTVEVEKPAQEETGTKYVTVVEKQLEPAFQDFVAKTKSYTNYEYKYTSPDSAYMMEVKVLGPKMRYHFKDHTVNYKLSEFYDTVLVDNGQMVAYQFCEDQQKCDLENLEFVRQVSYESRKIPTLNDVMDSIVKTTTLGTEMMMDKKSTKLQYTDQDGVTGIIWVDNYYGTPLKKEFMDGDDKKVELFASFIKGGVTEAMVNVPADRRLV
jgi:hypothetical protein